MGNYLKQDEKPVSISPQESEKEMVERGTLEVPYASKVPRSSIAILHTTIRIGYSIG